jgi:hypothetical protein
MTNFLDERTYVQRNIRRAAVQARSEGFHRWKDPNCGKELLGKFPIGYDYKKSIFRVLGVNRAKPSVQDKIGRKFSNYCGSLLHWAVLGNHLETVKMLCELGADVLLVIPKLEAKAIDIARCNGYVEVYHYLKEREKNL